MKHLIYIFAGLICCLVTLPQVGASPLENKKQRFRITVLNTGGEPQQGIILKVAGYSSEYISDEQGLIDFEQSIDNNYVRTANFYFPTDKNRTVTLTTITSVLPIFTSRQIRTEQSNPCDWTKQHKIQSSA